jgi:hypothetical protein
VNNLSSFDWNINKGDFIHYELSLVKFKKKEKMVKRFFTVSLVVLSCVMMLTLLHLAAKV